MAARIAATALCIATLATAEVLLGGKKMTEGQVLDAEQEGALPDIADPKMIKSLKCGLCQASVMEMAFVINKQENDLGRALKEVEVLEVLDKVCDVNMDRYGLLLDENGQPTTRWSNSVDTCNMYLAIAHLSINMSTSMIQVQQRK